MDNSGQERETVQEEERWWWWGGAAEWNHHLLAHPPSSYPRGHRASAVLQGGREGGVSSVGLRQRELKGDLEKKLKRWRVPESMMKEGFGEGRERGCRAD